MKNGTLKKTMALAMTAALAMSPMTAMASEFNTDPVDPRQEINGNGELEGFVNKNVFKIVLPTTPGIGFKLDPQGLLKVADPTKYTIGDGAVYFTNAAEAAVEMVPGTVSAFSITRETAASSREFESVSTGITVELAQPTDQTAAKNEYKNGVYTFNGTDKWIDEFTGVEIVNTSVTITDSDNLAAPASGDTITVTGYTKAKAEKAAAFTNTSDKIKIINKSSYDVDVEFDVEVTLPAGVSLVESAADLANATTPSVYLTMKEKDKDAVALKSKDTTRDGSNAPNYVNVYEAVKVDKVPTASGDAAHTNRVAGYEIKATGPDAQGKYSYSYGLSRDYDDDNADYAEFVLSGSCDSTADWSTVRDLDTNKNVQTKITWSAKKHVDPPTDVAPSVAQSTYTRVAGQPLEIEVNLGSGSLAANGIERVDVVYNGTENPMGAEFYEISGNKITLKDSLTTAWAGIDEIDIKIILDGGDPITVKLDK